jgi:pSer/pThr/pTyr-binding forkhead associated (FHA) protein
MLASTAVTPSATVSTNTISNVYGRLAVVKKDGVEGAFFDITSDILIGRNAECEIRIKIPSVSRKQSRLFIDETGNCCIESLSTSTATLLNGQKMEPNAPVKLQNRDEICVEGRKFVFHNGTTEIYCNISIIIKCDLFQTIWPVSAVPSKRISNSSAKRLFWTITRQ